MLLRGSGVAKGPAIVVCPISTIRGTWVEHLRNWTNIPSERVLICDDKRNIPDSAELLAAAYDVVLVTYSVLAIHFKQGWKYTVTPVPGTFPPKKIASWDRVGSKTPTLFAANYSIAMYDEAHNFRNSVTKNLTHASVRQLSSKATYRVAATGTVVVNKPDDPAAILDGMNVKHALANAKSWSNDKTRKTVSKFAATRFADEFQHRAGSSVIADKMPEIQSRTIMLDDPGFTADEREFYNESLQEAQTIQAMIRSNTADSQAMMRLTSLMTLMNRMVFHPELSLRSAAKCTPEQLTDIATRPSKKMLVISRAIDHILCFHSKVVVVSHQTSILALCQAACKERSLMFTGKLSATERSVMVDRFLKKPDEKVLFLSLKAGSEGLHLVSDIGPTAMIFVTCWYAASAHRQCEARIHRMGQKNDIEIVSVMVKGTLDDAIYRMHAEKTALSDAVMDKKFANLKLVGNDQMVWKSMGRLVSMCKPF